MRNALVKRSDDGDMEFLRLLALPGVEVLLLLCVVVMVVMVVVVVVVVVLLPLLTCPPRLQLTVDSVTDAKFLADHKGSSSAGDKLGRSAAYCGRVACLCALEGKAGVDLSSADPADGATVHTTHSPPFQPLAAAAVLVFHPAVHHRPRRLRRSRGSWHASRQGLLKDPPTLA